MGQKKNGSNHLTVWWTDSLLCAWCGTLKPLGATVMWQLVQGETQTSLSTATLQLLLWDLEVFLNQRGWKISPVCSWYVLGTRRNGTGKPPGDILIKCLNHLSHFVAKQQWLHSKLLLDDKAHHPITKAESGHAVKEASFGCFFCWFIMSRTSWP